MAVGNLDGYDLSQAGFIPESVMREIINAQKNIDLTLTSLIGEDSCGDVKHDWLKETLRQPKINAAVDGAPATGNDTQTGERVANHVQTFESTIEVSEIAQAVDTFDGKLEWSRQVDNRTMEVRRDLEAALGARFGSVRGTKVVAGRAAGISAFLTSNVNNGAGGGGNGYDPNTETVDGYEVGTRRALSFATVLDVARAVYNAGGNVQVGVSTVDMIARLITYILTPSNNAPFAAPVANVSGDSSGAVSQNAQGFVYKITTPQKDVIALHGSRLMFAYDDNDDVWENEQGSPQQTGKNVDLLLLDPSTIATVFLKYFAAKPLGKPGLSDRSQISAVATFRVQDEKTQGVIRDLNPDTAVVA